MQNWVEARYEEKAAEIARQHTVTRKPLTDLLEKAARDSQLDSDEVRTLGRLVNVKAFKEYFNEREKQGADRMVEFEVADPEVAIKRITSSAESLVAPATAYNDKLASELPNQMRLLRHPEPEITKEAASVVDDTPALKPPRPEKIARALEKLAGDLEIEVTQLGIRWEHDVRNLSTRFKLAIQNAPDFGKFAQDAVAAYGAKAMPEVCTLAQLLRLPLPAFSAEKIASLQAHRLVDRTPELTKLEGLFETRASYDERKRMRAVLNER